MSEAATIQEIRLALGRDPALRLFRHNQGALKDATGRVVRFGLHAGCPDLVGWRSVTIGPEHIGRTLAVFAGLEVKAPKGRHPVTPEQRQFLDVLTQAGGMCGVVTNTAQARLILGLPEP
jgi:hypothetical protein